MLTLSNGSLGRRAMLTGTFVAAAALRLATAGGATKQTTPLEMWSLFKARLVTNDGRVIDTDNYSISHSEGQGYGMIFAEHFNDLATFERIYTFTSEAMHRSGDALHAWRYVPDAVTPVSDKNNASDGDLLIGYALARAGARWNRPDFTAQARAIGRDILRLLVKRAGSRIVLLPGQRGFETSTTVTVNPSYYAFFAFAELDKVAPSPIWDELRRDGIKLLNDGRFGPNKLTPDWLTVTRADSGLAPAQGHPARFSYDAVRVPLYLAWSRLSDTEAARSIAKYWASTPKWTPAWVDIYTNEVANYPASPGVLAVRDLTLAASGVSSPAIMAGTNLPTGYYPASLMLLSEVARSFAFPAATAPLADATPSGNAKRTLA